MIRLFFALLSFALLSCGAKGTKETGNMPEIKKQPIASAVPDFNADSAYAYVANQVAFGPRVPNTAAHKACGDYLASELKRFGAKVYQQEAILTAYDGTKLEARNIIGSFDPRIVNVFYYSRIGTAVPIRTTIPILPSTGPHWTGRTMAVAA